MKLTAILVVNSIMLYIVVIANLCGCDRPEPPKTMGVVASDNSDYKVEILFTDKDKYTMKRFFDHTTQRWVYFATPGPTVVSQHWDTQEGKVTKHHSDAVETK